MSFIERNLRSMYLSDPVPLPKTPNISIYTFVSKENTFYLMLVLIAILLIILF
jgi:hypothetical protein